MHLANHCGRVPPSFGRGGRAGAGRLTFAPVACHEPPSEPVAQAEASQKRVGAADPAAGAATTGSARNHYGFGRGADITAIGGLGS